MMLQRLRRLNRINSRSILSLTAYLLAHWAHLHSGGGALPDWGEAAQLALELLLPLMVLFPLLAEIQRLQHDR